jgi:hypothetical protein
VSVDGVNVLLDESGKKKGRPAERPRGGAKAKNPDESPSAYKNAMVGSISFYGEVPVDEKAPQRLCSIYTAHMPEDKAPTFKGWFEAELAAIHARLPDGVVKVLINDGARNIWKYIEGNPLFDGYEQIVDYWHVVEHVSLAAEALFGKGSEEGKRW